MKQQFLKTILLSVTFVLSISANAGLVTQHTSVETFQRTCPGLQDPNYADKWRDIVELLYNKEPGTAGAEIMCHFNGSWQLQIYNFDGSIRVDSPFPNMPEGSAYTADEVGDLERIKATGSNQTTLGTEGGDYFGNVTLDDSNLGLPQLKITSRSDAFERNSVNGYAATEYLWTGETQTLEYSVDFDFFNSGGMWNIPGAADDHDYIFNLYVGAFHDMVFDPNTTFPIDYGTELAFDSFDSGIEPLISSSLNNPYQGSLSLSFEVNTGEKFFLYSQVQAFGLNGGFTDASHTVTSRLEVQGLTQSQSEQVFSSALTKAVPSANVPEPSSLAIFALGVFGLASRRFKNR